MNLERLRRAYLKARTALLDERTPEGFWVGELSSSALATATAITALKLAAPDATLIERGLNWLVAHQNADGGWGDTTKSFSNISTTMLCRAALHLCDSESRFVEARSRCETWLADRHGKTPKDLAESVRQRYGRDRTFAVPILTMCALAGLVAWKEVPRLPFELACLPQSWYRFARLPVVSYALPALIAIGQCVHHHRSTWNPVTLLLRWLGKKRSLRVLQRIQPSSGGYLEATPLTSFVVMSLAAIRDPRTKRMRGPLDHVIDRGIEFIRQSARADGSWPIDSNLSIWLTTLSVNALAAAEDLQVLDRKNELLDWLLDQQTKERHRYTGAAAGGWGWSHLPGSVPDCDDTPGAVLAIRNIDPSPIRSDAVLAATAWMHGLQNRDHGFPTFCRGWGLLPFDRSGTDLTAHVMRAWRSLDLAANASAGRRIQSCFQYLARQQRPDSSWLPLWFGNQHAPDDINPTYGTAKVLAAYRDYGLMECAEAKKGIAFLLSIQNEDGGWGGAKSTPSSVEETALVVEALVDHCKKLSASDAQPLGSIERGIDYLVERVENETFTEASPIGFYFAKLWYYEKLYPVIFTVAALGRALRLGERSV